MLVTQNIDDYHGLLIKDSKVLSGIKDNNLDKYGFEVPLAFTPHLYEVHGNVFYMHCEDEESDHSKIFFRCPKLSDVKDKQNHVPKCATCDKRMKPHSMFFDESYSEHYYRKDTVDAFYEDADLLIVIGTALQTGYAMRIVCTFLDKEKPVIEVNMETAIGIGHLYQLIGKSEVLLPKMFDVYYGKKPA
jgi:NAD-dependent SIR2 family protein deacetylase